MVVGSLTIDRSDYVTGAVIPVDGGWYEGDARTRPVLMLARKMF